MTRFAYRTVSMILILAVLLTTIPFSFVSAATDGDFTYSVTGGKATVTDYNGTATQLEIPATLGGYTVTTIGYSAFYDCDRLVNVTIPSSVTTIGYYAFSYCGNIERVVIPKSVTTINDNAFDGCVALQDIYYSGNENDWDNISIGSYNSSIYSKTKITFDVVAVRGNEEYDYVITKDNTVSIAKYKGTATDVDLPATIEGLSVTAVGNNAFFGCYAMTSMTIPDSVTTIGNSAFSYCYALTSITLPDSVTTIGNSAFSSCEALTSVTIPDSVTTIANSAFYDCDALTSITLPDSVTTIGNSAFSGCIALTSIMLPDSVTTIGESAFSYCKALTSIAIPDGVAVISYDVFSDCRSLTNVVIPDSVTTIGESAFSGCIALTSITIPDSVTTIGESAFSGCIVLTSITIPDSVTTIGNSAFSGCNVLACITLPDGITTIGNNAFYCCRALTSITIPDGVTIIGNSAFSGCHALTSITIPDSVTTIGNSAFSYCYALTSMTIPGGVTTIGNKAFYDCDALTSITLPDSVTTIGEAAFSNSGALTSITIPDSVTTIGNSVFLSCNNLANVTIGNGVTTIGTNAFFECNRLTSITIPDGVTIIGGGAFSYCDSLANVSIGNGVKTIGQYAFYHCVNLKNVYYSGSESDWNNISIGSDNSYLIKAYQSIGSGSNANYDYFIMPDNTIDIAKYNGNEADVIIPDTIDGFPVAVIGDEAFYNYGSLISVTIPDSVTMIGIKAFSGCSYLTNVVIGGGVKTIDVSAFANCYKITSMVIPDSVTIIGDSAFSYCSGLTSVTIGNSVTTIGDSAFYYCDALISVTIPNSVASIGEDAFYNCKGLTKVVLGNGVTKVGAYAFYGCDSLKNVYYSGSESDRSKISFEYGSNYLTGATWAYNAVGGGSNGQYDYYLTMDGTIGIAKYIGTETEITIPDKIEALPVTVIGTNAFKNNDSLMNITIPDSVTTIGSYVFYDCDGLTGITIPDGVTMIDEYTFYSCNNLMSVYIPDSVTTIGYSAFYYCGNLEYVYYSGSESDWNAITIKNNNSDLIGVKRAYNVSGFGSNTEYDYYTAKDGTVGIIKYKGIETAVVIPDRIEGASVTAIESKAFYGCSTLTSITIPDSVTSIGNAAFEGCRSLKSIMIPAGVTSIGENTFYGCTALTSITIPESVTLIGDSAFEGCDVLEKVFYGTDYYYSLSFFDVIDIGYTNSPLYDAQIIYNAVADGKTDVYAYVVTPQNTVRLTEYFGDYQTIVIPATIDDMPVEEIGEQLFYYDSNWYTIYISRLTIPDSVTMIYPEAFEGCEIGKVLFSGTHEQWNAMDIAYGNDALSDTSVVYGAVREGKFGQYDYYVMKEDTICVYYYHNYDEASNAVIPATIEGMPVTEIAGGAFEGDTLLYSVVIPEGVTTIGYNSFDNCTNLRAVVLPGTLTNLDHGAFDGCKNLSHIFFTGTKAQWKEIDGALPTDTATYHYGVSVSDFSHEDMKHCSQWGATHYDCAICDMTFDVAYGIVWPIGHHVFKGDSCRYCGMNAVSYLHSDHPYANNASDFKTLQQEGAVSVSVTFSDNTYVEDDYDFIYIYDRDYTLVGTYTGSQLAGQTITVVGDTLHICLESDDTENAYGYDVVAVAAEEGILGDIDGNGTVNMRDVMTMYAAVSKGRALTEKQQRYADYDGNGVVNIRDVMSLYKVLAKG